MKTLIVEDEATSARLLSVALSAYGTVIHAKSSVEAFDLYRDAMESEEPFSLICLDLELPEFDGLEFLDEIRRTEIDQQISPEKCVKVIVTTGHSDPETFFNANSVGCNSFLTKPLNRSKLDNELKRLDLLPDTDE